MGDLPGAKRSLERSLAIDAKVHGTEDHPGVAASLHALAVLTEDEDPQRALELYQRVLGIERKLYGSLDQYHSAETEFALGMLLTRLGRANEATPVLAHAIAVLRVQVPNHPILQQLDGSGTGVHLDPARAAHLALRARAHPDQSVDTNFDELIAAMHSAGSPHDAVATFLRQVAIGVLPPLPPNLPPTIVGFLTQVAASARAIDDQT
jgi:tetratricopeptide (TPR) repeat protein